MIKLLIIFLSFNLLAEDPYQKDLLKLKSEMKDFGISLGLFSENPFQTGTNLNNYYLSEKTLLLSRDTFFQLRGNKVETIEELADFTHRTKVLKIHAQNMLFQLMKSILKKEEDPLLVLENEKTKRTLSELQDDCGGEVKCIEKEHKENPEQINNILTSNLNLSSGVIDSMLYMHAIESQSVYHLTQLLFLEVIYSQNVIDVKGPDFFLEKQKKLLEEIEKNPYLSKSEYEYQKAVLANHIGKWKLKVLENKENTSFYIEKLKKIKTKNRLIMKEIISFRNKNKKEFGYLLSERDCKKKSGRMNKKWCKSFFELEKDMQKVLGNKDTFLSKKKQKLPKKFWKKN